MYRVKEFFAQALMILIYCTIAFMCIYPFYYVFLVSVSDPLAVAQGKVMFTPSGFTTQYYHDIFLMPRISNAFLVSVARTVLGTMLTVLFSSVLAYVVTKKEMPARKIVYRLTIFTLYVSAGLIPWFLTMMAYGLQNNFLLYILPSALSPFAVILIKTYIEEAIPSEIEESAVMDGANYFVIFTQFILPLSKPILMAIAVFAAVSQWNSWQDNFFLVSDDRLQTMQYTLMQFLRQAEIIARAMQQNYDQTMMEQLKNIRVDPLTVRAAVTMVTVLPILIVYPVLQRHFVKGLMIGSIKG